MNTIIPAKKFDINKAAYKKIRKKIMNRGDQFKTYKYTNKRMNKYSRHIEGCVHKDSVCSVCMTPDGKYVVSGSENGTLRITRFDNGKLVREIKSHQYEVDAFCPFLEDTFTLRNSRIVVSIV